MRCPKKNWKPDCLAWKLRERICGSKKESRGFAKSPCKEGTRACDPPNRHSTPWTTYCTFILFPGTDMVYRSVAAGQHVVQYSQRVAAYGAPGSRSASEGFF